MINRGELLKAGSENLSLAELEPVDLDALGHVVYRWQRASKYLDEDGRPLRLTLRGKGPSLQSLFRETGHKAYFPAGVKHLRDVGRIKKTRDGCYLPSEK